jgi:2-oxo-3-hexenedioate decarboxylase
MAVPSAAVEEIAAEAVAILGTGRQIAPFSARFPDFALADAYHVTATVRTLRECRSERPVGRKIGCTNRMTWPDYAPMWSYVYDRTVHDLAAIDGTFALTGLACADGAR